MTDEERDDLILKKIAREILADPVSIGKMSHNMMYNLLFKFSDVCVRHVPGDIPATPAAPAQEATAPVIIGAVNPNPNPNLH